MPVGFSLDDLERLRQSACGIYASPDNWRTCITIVCCTLWNNSQCWAEPAVNSAIIRKRPGGRYNHQHHHCVVIQYDVATVKLYKTGDRQVGNYQPPTAEL